MSVHIVPVILFNDFPPLPKPAFGLALSPAQQEEVIDVLRSRCAFLQNIWETIAKENSELRRELLRRNQLLIECSGPLDMLRSLVDEPASVDDLYPNAKALCDALLACIEDLARVKGARSNNGQPNYEDAGPDIGQGETDCPDINL